jgi:mono/diheme cytochrome c family protein
MWRAFFFVSCLLLGACGEDSKPEAGAAQGEEVIRGKRVYMAYCIACHNTDPSKDGPIGPAVKGSSQALLEAKVLRGNYPPGYKPKRDTAVMPAQPALKPSIPDLAALLR